MCSFLRQQTNKLYKIWLPGETEQLFAAVQGNQRAISVELIILKQMCVV